MKDLRKQSSLKWRERWRFLLVLVGFCCDVEASSRNSAAPSGTPLSPLSTPIVHSSKPHRRGFY